MNSACINHPEKERLIIVREWQVDFCDGNTCAAALLSFFEYWRNIKLDIIANAKNKNEPSKDQDKDLWQFHTAEQLARGIMLYGRSSITAAITLLESKGVIVTGRNPNPCYKFDRTRHFLFKPEVANNFLQLRSIRTSASLTENGSRLLGRSQTIPETTPETPTEVTSPKTTPSSSLPPEAFELPPKAIPFSRRSQRQGIATLIKKLLGKKRDAYGGSDDDGGIYGNLFNEVMFDDPRRSAWLDLPYDRVKELTKEATTKGREEGTFKRLLIELLDKEISPFPDLCLEEFSTLTKLLEKEFGPLIRTDA